MFTSILYYFLFFRIFKSKSISKVIKKDISFLAYKANGKYIARTDEHRSGIINPTRRTQYNVSVSGWCFSDVVRLNQNVAREMYPYIPNWHFFVFPDLPWIPILYLFIFSFLTFCEIGFATCPEILIELLNITLMSYPFPIRFRFRFHGKRIHDSEIRFSPPVILTKILKSMYAMQNELTL